MTTKKIARICIMENCERPSRGQQYCLPHYKKMRRQGVIGLVYIARTNHCQIPECELPMKGGAKGYCCAHYQRLRNFGRLELSDKFNRKCTIEGCKNKHRGMGYCSTHLERFHTTGDPLLRTNGIWGDTIDHQFWARVAVTQKDDQCWEWQAGKEGGYGILQVNKKQWKAHRFAWFLYYGSVPSLYVLHSCDNRACVNPKHLREGTPQDNANDAVERHRLVSGEDHAYAKFTNKQVVRIRNRFAAGERMCDLAREYNVSKSTLRSIKYGRSYKSVPL